MALLYTFGLASTCMDSIYKACNTCSNTNVSMQVSCAHPNKETASVDEFVEYLPSDRQ